MNARLNVYLAVLLLMGLTQSDVHHAQDQPCISNGKLVFVSEMDGDPEIYIIDPDGTGLQQLTDNDSFDAYPSWSPDGTRIAFTHEQGISFDIYTMDADSSNQTKVENTFGGRRPVWSPDGTKLAFEQTSTGLSDVVVINLADSTTVNLTNSPMELDQSPAWSPDGSGIAFASSGNYGVPRVTDGDPRMDIYVINADGTNRTQTVLNVSFLGGLNWISNDTIIYSAMYASRIFSLYLPDGTVTPLTDITFDSWSPTVSPDGTQIAFLQDNQLAIMGIDGSDVTAITSSNDNKRDPDWQPVISAAPEPTSTPEKQQRRTHQCTSF